MAKPLVDESELDVDAIQAQIDMAMSANYGLVSTWMKQPSSSKASSSAPAKTHMTQRELEDYMRRPPRLGLGASVPKSETVLSRDAARLAHKLTNGSATAKGKKRAREDEDALAGSRSDDDEDGESRSRAIGSSVASKKLKARSFGEQLEMRKGKKKRTTQVQPPAKKPRRSTNSDDNDASKTAPSAAPTTKEPSDEEDIDMDDMPVVSDRSSDETVAAEPAAPTSAASTSITNTKGKKRKKPRNGEGETHEHSLRVGATPPPNASEDELEPNAASSPANVPGTSDNMIASSTADTSTQPRRKRKKKKKKQYQQPDGETVAQGATTASANPSVPPSPASAKGNPVSLKAQPDSSPSKGGTGSAPTSPVPPFKFTAKTVLNLDGPPPPDMASGDGCGKKRRRKKKKKVQQAAAGGQPSVPDEHNDGEEE